MEINEKKLQFIFEVGKLKHLKRRGWVLRNILDPEPISAHMYRMSIMSLLLNSTADIRKVMQLCLIHDIAECIVGDIVPSDGISREDKLKLEMDAVKYLVELLPEQSSKHVMELFTEYEKQETVEAQITKDLDRFDLVCQAFEYLKSEYERTGKIANLEEFFAEEIIKSIKNEEISQLAQIILNKREDFLKFARV